MKQWTEGVMDVTRGRADMGTKKPFRDSMLQWSVFQRIRQRPQGRRWKV